MSNMLYVSNIDDITTRFNLLSPEEREIFTDMFMDWRKTQGFNLNELVAAKSDDGIKCPHCDNMEPKGIQKFGIRRRVQYYRCKACTRIFSGVTDTFLRWTKKDFWTWKTFVKCMIEGRSIRKSAEICKVSTRTIFMWRHKLLDALSAHHNNQPRMKGIVEADDTFFQLSYKGGTVPEGRDVRYRGGPADTAGISKKDKVCVSCAVSRSGQIYSKISAMGFPKAESLQRVFRNRFSKKAVLCTDKGKAYVKYGQRRSFTHILMESGLWVWGPYHVQNINSYHSQLKHFIRKFKGVSTKYLNNYLVWHNVITHKNYKELLKIAIKAPVHTRWRDICDRPAIPV